MSPMAKMPGRRGLELLGVGRDQVLVEVQPPIGDRPELHGQPEEGQQRVAGDLEGLAVAVAAECGRQRGAVALQPGDLADAQIHRALRDQRAHLLDRMRRGAELVAAVHQRDAPGDRLQVQASSRGRNRRRRRSGCRGRGSSPSCARRRRRSCPHSSRCRGSAASWAGRSRRRPQPPRIWSRTPCRHRWSRGSAAPLRVPSVTHALDHLVEMEGRR